MEAELFPMAAAAAPVAAFFTAAVLFWARLRSRPLGWGKAALVAALGSALLASAALALVVHLFTGGAVQVNVWEVAAVSAAVSAAGTLLVGAGAWLVEKSR